MFKEMLLKNNEIVYPIILIIIFDFIYTINDDLKKTGTDFSISIVFEKYKEMLIYYICLIIAGIILFSSFKYEYKFIGLLPSLISALGLTRIYRKTRERSKVRMVVFSWACCLLSVLFILEIIKDYL